ncbi:MAG: type II secretion system protein [Phycisphaerales bacterium]
MKQVNRVPQPRAFTIVELLVVVGLIVILIAILVPSLFAARGAASRTDAMSRLKQIGEWSTLYSNESRQYLVPAVFDYSTNPVSGAVRSNVSADGLPINVGTWTDILWSKYVDVQFDDAVSGGPGHNYEVDSPDDALHSVIPTYDDDPFRSPENNSLGNNRGKLGYFAMNLFFDSTRNGNNNWYTIGQIRQPDRSLSVIDSFGGVAPANSIDKETILDDYGPWGVDYGGLVDQKVDYRYAGEALALFLDGHVEGVGEVDDLDELEQDRKVKVRNLTQ